MKTIFILIGWLSFPLLASSAHFTTEHWKTKNGAHVVFYQAMEVPMLDIRLAFKAGSAYDGAQFGISALTTRLLNQGSEGVDADTIADKLAETGAQYASTTSQDMAVFSLKTLTRPDALNRSIAVFTSILTHPDFPVRAFEHEKKQQLMSIAQVQESPDEMANQAFFQALYQQHPYAHPINGSQDSVGALNIKDTQHFYHQFFVAQNAVIVLVGAIDKTTAKNLSEQLTRHLVEGSAADLIPKATPNTKDMQIDIPFSASQTNLRLGQLGITHHDPEYFPLMVGNYILGGGSLVSRLANEVREKRGLTYGVTSQFAPMPGIGPFVIGLSTNNNQAQTALDVTKTTLLAFLKSGPTQEELIAAKRYLTGSFPLSLASNKSIADMLLKIAFYQLPDNYLDTYVDKINAVTTLDINHAFDQHIYPNLWLQIAVGKLSK